jgi:hypothetical protein
MAVGASGLLFCIGKRAPIACHGVVLALAHGYGQPVASFA